MEGKKAKSVGCNLQEGLKMLHRIPQLFTREISKAQQRTDTRRVLLSSVTFRLLKIFQTQLRRCL